MAILVPTTSLVQQHHATFADRYSGFPLNVAPLSRFQSDAESKATKEAIKDGKVRGVRSIDLAPTAAFLMDIPAPQQSQGIVRRDMLAKRPVDPRVEIDGGTLGRGHASILAV